MGIETYLSPAETVAMRTEPAVRPPEASPDTLLNGYEVEDQVGFLRRRTNQRHTALFQEGMAEADLTPTQEGQTLAVRAAAITQRITEATLAPLDAAERTRKLA